MIQKTEKKGYAMSVLFTMLLFLVFVLSALFMVLTGSRVYGNITVRSDLSYMGNTIPSCTANKVCQGDQTGLADVVDVDGTGAPEMKQEIGGSEYVTWIYRKDGTTCEPFTDTQSGLGLEDGLEILECGGLELRKGRPLLHIETLGEGGGAISLSLRSGGLEMDE